MKPKRRLRKFILLLIMAALLICLGWLGWQFITPDIKILARKNPAQTSMIQLRQKEWQAKRLKRRPLHIWRPLSRISPYLVQAVLIAEDDKFFGHEGFDLDMLQKAVERNLEAGEFKFGASTISQQLAKNLFLTPERSLLRKLREAIYTWRLENCLSKQRILELYLNFVEWGPGIFGAEAASQYHYGISADQLSPDQAARLAVVLPNPLRMDPNSGTEYVTKRGLAILRIMQQRGYGKVWK